MNKSTAPAKSLTTWSSTVNATPWKTFSTACLSTTSPSELVLWLHNQHFLRLSTFSRKDFIVQYVWCPQVGRRNKNLAEESTPHDLMSFLGGGGLLHHRTDDPFWHLLPLRHVLVGGLQTQTGDRARACTKEEFRKVMHKIKKAAVEKVVRAFPEVFSSKDGPLPLVFSLDNATIHDDAAITRKYAGVACERLQLPSPCCDMQKVIEHVFGSMSREFQSMLLEKPSNISIQEYKKMCRAAFEKVSQASSIRKDANTLPSTLTAIIKAKGGWPPKAFR